MSGVPLDVRQIIMNYLGYNEQCILNKYDPKLMITDLMCDGGIVLLSNNPDKYKFVTRLNTVTNYTKNKVLNVLSQFKYLKEINISSCSKDIFFSYSPYEPYDEINEWCNCVVDNKTDLST